VDVLIASEADHVVYDGVPIELQEYPQVMRHVLMLWGTRGCRDYLRSFILDESRTRTRIAKFPASFVQKLMAVQIGHDTVYPQFIAADAHVRATWKLPPIPSTGEP